MVGRPASRWQPHKSEQHLRDHNGRGSPQRGRESGLLRWTAAYAMGLLLFWLSVKIGQVFHSESIPEATYLLVGLALNRHVLRAMSHSGYRRRPSRAALNKLLSFLLWPLAYGLLLFQLLIIVVL